jgi:hypothetical protein
MASKGTSLPVCGKSYVKELEELIQIPERSVYGHTLGEEPRRKCS